MKHKLLILPYFIILLLIFCGCLPKRSFIALPLRPDNIFLFEEGKTRFLERDYTKASKILETYLFLYPLGLKAKEVEEILYKTGLIYSNKSLRSGIDFFEKLLRKEKIAHLRPLFLHTLGWFYLKEKNYPKAITTWQKGLLEEDEKLHPYFLYSLGSGYYEEGNLKEAISTWLRLYKDYPQQELAKDALYRASLLFFDLKEFQKARYFLKELIKRYPHSQEAERASFILSQIYLHMEENEKKILYQQGLSFLREKEVERAIKDFEEIVEGEDSLYKEDAYYQLAFSYYLLSKKEMAKAYFQKLLEEYPQSRWASSAALWIKAIGN